MQSGWLQRQFAPHLLLLLKRVVEQIAMNRERRLRHVFDHAFDEPRFDHPHNRHMLRHAGQIELIDARAHREHHFQIGKRAGRVFGRLPCDQIADRSGIAVIGPDMERQTGRLFGEEPRPLQAARRVGFIE
jgi:hypothetical protein